MTLNLYYREGATAGSQALMTERRHIQVTVTSQHSDSKPKLTHLEFSKQVGVPVFEVYGQEWRASSFRLKTSEALLARRLVWVYNRFVFTRLECKIFPHATLRFSSSALTALRCSRAYTAPVSAAKDRPSSRTEKLNIRFWRYQKKSEYRLFFLFFSVSVSNCYRRIGSCDNHSPFWPLIQHLSIEIQSASKDTLTR